MQTDQDEVLSPEQFAALVSGAKRTVDRSTAQRSELDERTVAQYSSTQPGGFQGYPQFPRPWNGSTLGNFQDALRNSAGPTAAPSYSSQMPTGHSNMHGHGIPQSSLLHGTAVIPPASSLEQFQSRPIRSTQIPIHQLFGDPASAAPAPGAPPTRFQPPASASGNPPTPRPDASAPPGFSTRFRPPMHPPQGSLPFTQPSAHSQAPSWPTNPQTSAAPSTTWQASMQSPRRADPSPQPFAHSNLHGARPGQPPHHHPPPTHVPHSSLAAPHSSISLALEGPRMPAPAAPGQQPPAMYGRAGHMHSIAAHAQGPGADAPRAAAIEQSRMAELLAGLDLSGPPLSHTASTADHASYQSPNSQSCVAVNSAAHLPHMQRPPYASPTPAHIHPPNPPHAPPPGFHAAAPIPAPPSPHPRPPPPPPSRAVLRHDQTPPFRLDQNAALGERHAPPADLLACLSRPPLGAGAAPSARPRPIPDLQLRGGRKNVKKAPHAGAQNPNCAMWDIDAACLQLFLSLLPTNGEMNLLQASFRRVQDILTEQFPDGRVHLFGSAANGLCITCNNDLDITLHVDDVKDMDNESKGMLVKALADTLKAENMLEVTPLEKARVPVVKFILPGAKTHVDVTINNELPLVNTQWIKTCAAIDDRLRQLIFIVKHWAKRRQINDAYRGTLSSYAYVLLCIFVAQKAGLVPVLQQERPFDVDTIVVMNDAEWVCQFNTDVERHCRAAAANPLSIGGLLTMFFDYYAHRFDFNSEVVCPRLGRTIRKDELGWVKKVGSERHLCCIQDPFLLTHDLGRTVDKNTRFTLQAEFERAARIMYNHQHDPIAELVQPYRPPNESKAK